MMDKVINLAKQRGFIFPGSEIYGGLANSYDLGPLGVELKKNIKDLWWQMFVRSRQDVVGMDANIIMNTKVWEGSGHLESFNDELVECKNCHERYKAEDLGDKCSNCGKDKFTKPQAFNTMFKTNLGPVEAEENTVYLRPETAQSMFVDFKQILDSSRQKIPFGIAQIGKAFRNEITPGNFIFRTREFEQMEIEYFIHPDTWEEHFDEWLAEMKRWVKAVGIDESKVHYEEITGEELAHYSKRTIDVEFEFPFGQSELYGIAYRTDYDLQAHSDHSGKELLYRDPETGEKYIPHVIEPSLGVERTMLAVLLSAYEEVEGGRSDSSDKEKEVVLRLPKSIAPVKAAVFPLSKKEKLPEIAKDITDDLSAEFNVEYDESGSIGRRYRRQDEIGTPFCITVDFDTKDDKKVTVRDRDTMEQDRVVVKELKSYLEGKLTE